jgi:hypothetical protein
MGITHWRIVQIPSASNPMFGVKRLSLNRELIHGCRVDAQHQAGIFAQLTQALLLWPWAIGIDTALNLRDMLLKT